MSATEQEMPQQEGCGGDSNNNNNNNNDGGGGGGDSSSDNSVIMRPTPNTPNSNTKSNINTHSSMDRRTKQLSNSDRLSSTRSLRAVNQAAFIRSNNEETAMSQSERAKIKVKNFVKKFTQSSSVAVAAASEIHNSRHNIIPPGLQLNALSKKSISKGSNNNNNNKSIGDDEQDDPQQQQQQQQQQQKAPQYRLEAFKNSQRNGCFSWCNIGGDNAGTKSDNLTNPNEQLARSLHWMFRSSFLVLFAVMCTVFFGWIIFFAGLVLAAGRYDHECVRVGGEPFANATSQFADAFTLSWTTFSTVGYGSTYPALSHENDDPANCFFITSICSLESFMGVLYAGFCGAILFGKVLRIQSHAQVIFSDPIVVRYGSGMQEHVDESELIGDNDEDINKKIPCPVLEFSITNRLFGDPGGEIIDASLNVVANVNARDVDPVLIDALNVRRSKHLRTYSYGGQDDNNTLDSLLNGSISDDDDDDTAGSGRGSLDSRQSRRRRKMSTTPTIFDSLIKRQHLAVDEDPSSRLVNKRIFSKMTIEAGEHPYFKRRWVGRHILDEDSPLVKPRVKRMIRKNKGYWPESLNDYAAVRESILFNQILVSLNGVSNLSASEVYAQKIYDFVDMNVGYQFVNTLYKDDDGALKVDTDLINDVREQHGGGGEPLILGD